MLLILLLLQLSCTVLSLVVGTVEITLLQYISSDRTKYQPEFNNKNLRTTFIALNKYLPFGSNEILAN